MSKMSDLWSYYNSQDKYIEKNISESNNIQINIPGHKDNEYDNKELDNRVVNIRLDSSNTELLDTNVPVVLNMGSYKDKLNNVTSESGTKKETTIHTINLNNTANSAKDTNKIKLIQSSPVNDNLVSKLVEEGKVSIEEKRDGEKEYKVINILKSDELTSTDIVAIRQFNAAERSKLLPSISVSSNLDPSVEYKDIEYVKDARTLSMGDVEKNLEHFDDDSRLKRVKSYAPKLKEPEISLEDKGVINKQSQASKNKITDLSTNTDISESVVSLSNIDEPPVIDDSDIVNNVPTGFSALGDRLSTNFTNSLRDVEKDVVGEYKRVGTSALNLVNSLSNQVGSTLDTIMDPLIKITNAPANIVNDILQDASDAVTDATKQVKDVVSGFKSKVVKEITNNETVSKVKNVYNNVLDKISNFGSELLSSEFFTGDSVKRIPRNTEGYGFNDQNTGLKNPPNKPRRSYVSNITDSRYDIGAQTVTSERMFENNVINENPMSGKFYNKVLDNDINSLDPAVKFKNSQLKSRGFKGFESVSDLSVESEEYGKNKQHFSVGTNFYWDVILTIPEANAYNKESNPNGIPLFPFKEWFPIQSYQLQGIEVSTNRVSTALGDFEFLDSPTMPTSISLNMYETHRMDMDRWMNKYIKAVYRESSNGDIKIIPYKKQCIYVKFYWYDSNWIPIKSEKFICIPKPQFSYEGSGDKDPKSFTMNLSIVGKLFDNDDEYLDGNPRIFTEGTYKLAQKR